MCNGMCTYAGRQMEENMYEQVEHESVKKLPWDMLIPNSQIRVLESIGQGKLHTVKRPDWLTQLQLECKHSKMLSHVVQKRSG